MTGTVRKTENHFDMTDFLDWNVKLFYVSVIKVPVGMEGSSEILFTCVKNYKLSRIYDWMNAKI